MNPSRSYSYLPVDDLAIPVGLALGFACLGASSPAHQRNMIMGYQGFGNEFREFEQQMAAQEAARLAARKTLAIATTNAAAKAPTTYKAPAAVAPLATLSAAAMRQAATAKAIADQVAKRTVISNAAAVAAAASPPSYAALPDVPPTDQALPPGFDACASQGGYRDVTTGQCVLPGQAPAGNDATMKYVAVAGLVVAVGVALYLSKQKGK